MRSTFITLFLILSTLIKAGGNDIELEMNFSGMENGVHEGRTGILSITLLNHGATTQKNPHISGGFITSLSGEGASPYFMNITENLDSSCNFVLIFILILYQIGFIFCMWAFQTFLPIKATPVSLDTKFCYPTSLPPVMAPAPRMTQTPTTMWYKSLSADLFKASQSTSHGWRLFCSSLSWFLDYLPVTKRPQIINLFYNSDQF